MQSRIDRLLIAMMEHKKKDVKRIQHFLKVHGFVRLIGQMEGLPTDVQEALEAAAVVHDIGIHSIVFPAISIGVYRFPKVKAANIAVQALPRWKGSNAQYPIYITLFCFDRETWQCACDLLCDVAS